MNKQLTEFKTQAEKEKAAIAKEHKAEIKSWMKDLGEERKQKIKSEKKIEELSEKVNSNPVDNDCIQASQVRNCKEAPDGCKHSPQCIIRQPLPPPSLVMPFLQNQDSKYYEHMMSTVGVPGNREI